MRVLDKHNIRCREDLDDAPLVSPMRVHDVRWEQDAHSHIPRHGVCACVCACVCQADDIKIYLRQLVPASQVAAAAPTVRAPVPLHTVATATAESHGSGRARRSSNTGLMASPYGAAVLHSDAADLHHVGPVALQVRSMTRCGAHARVLVGGLVDDGRAGQHSSCRSPSVHSCRTHTPWLMPATLDRGCTHWGMVILGDGMAVTAHVLRVVCGSFAGAPPTRGFRAPCALPTALHAPCTRQQQWQRGPSHVRGVWRPQATASALQGRRSQQWRARRTCARGGREVARRTTLVQVLPELHRTIHHLPCHVALCSLSLSRAVHYNCGVACDRLPR